MFKKLFLILFGLILLTVAAGTFAYSSDNQMFDRLFPLEVRQRREYARMRALFPDTLENYELYDRGSEKIRMGAEECNRIEDHPDTKGLGMSGEMCGKTVIAQYREQSGDRVVFVHGLITTKGEELQRAYLSKVTQPVRIGSADAFRLERHEIGWYPSTQFDVLLTQEGRWKAQSDGGESMSYREIATGDNPVTQYFLMKFSPRAETQ